jgi:Mg2+ and Co2+ transporter CorA
MRQAFNNLARQDNDIMKSIALLTMIFLPATFISVCGHEFYLARHF